MELRQLQYLVAVADEASFTRAAAKAHVAQPGVSAQVRQLERELGHALFDRSGGRVRLTEVGTAVLPYARAALGAVAGVRHTADAFAGLVRGHLTVGTVGSISSPSVDLPGVLARFHHDHPRIEITLTEATSADLIEGLRTGRFDVALVSLGAEPLPEGIATRVVASERLVVAVSRRDPLAGSAAVGLEDIRDRALICLPRGTGLRSLIEHACAAAGFQPRIAFEAGDPHVLAQLAERGLGATILPEPVARGHHGDLHILALVRPHLDGRIALAWRTGGPASPAARAFLSHAGTQLAPPRG